MFYLPRNIKLKVHQRILASLAIIALFVITYIANNLFTINHLDKKFNVVTQQAVPLTKLSTELLSQQTDYLQLVHGIDRLQSTNELDAKQKELTRQAETIKVTLNRLKNLSEPFKTVAPVIPQLRGDFAQLQQTGSQLLTIRNATLLLTSLLPGQFSTLQTALSDLKQHIVYVSEDSDVEISTEVYHIVEHANRLSEHTTTLYFSGESDAIDQAAPAIKTSLSTLASNIKKLESLDEFDSADWDIALDSFYLMKKHLEAPEYFLKNIKQLATKKQDYETLITLANEQSTSFSDQIKSLNLATQSILSEAGSIFADTLSRNRYVIFLLSLVVFSVIVLIGYKLQKSIKTPLTALKKYVDQLEAGDLTHRLTLDSGDEFEEAAEKMNNLTARLNDVMKAIGKQANDAESTADYVVDASQELSNVLNEQISQVREINHFMETLKNASEQVSENVNSTYVEIDKVSARTTDATQESHKSSASVGNLMKLLTETKETVVQLAEDIHEIHGMTDLISDVADQTNLLALNAAIEAARAGQHGRGFAVVADEVRALAASTQKTTDIIRSRIEKIVLQSNKSKGDVDQSYTIAEQVHQIFLSNAKIMEQIDQATEDLSNFTAQVSAAAANQNEYINSCEKSLKKIDTLAQLNSATFEGISTIMQTLVGLTQHLSKDADYFEYEGKETRTEH